MLATPPLLLLLSTATIILQSAISATAFVGAPHQPERSTSIRSTNNRDENDGDGLSSSLLPPLLSSPERRNILSRAASMTMGTLTASALSTTAQQHLPAPSSEGYYCQCCRLYRPPTANAIVELTPPPPDLVQSYDRPRNSGLDSFFSYSMSVGMDEYETKARPYKTRLFQTLFDSLVISSQNDGSSNRDTIPVVLEVGMGTFPNAPYYSQALTDSALNGLDIISVDPNDSMFDYAKESAEKAGLISSSSSSSLPNNNNSLRNVHGVAEALPFADDSVDAVVGTLTLCSVTDQERALSEIRRVLKPKSGKFLFWEHVLSEDETGLALQQKILSPIQTFVADGCHLDRRTGVMIQNAGFRGGVEMEYLMLGDSIISPTVFGIATA